ncbi:MAG: gfo/Idh/MocA family oxidoreductase [Planctomycetota bacterium]|nr:MAG: gfo/Idh/MocA family oxidoreductase [Planctomycetota bacterium]
MNSRLKLTRRSAIKTMGIALTAPMVFKRFTQAAPSETLMHASFGAGGMARSDINSLTASKNLKLVAVADVDKSRLEELKKSFPDVKVYTDWRELLDKEKGLNSANISTPDHMHAPITMRAMQQGLNVYTQKPLTQSIYESRQLTKVAAEKKLVTQMGIQIHSHEVHKTVVNAIQTGVVGKVKEIYSWSGKQWGDKGPRPEKTDAVPATLDWNGWLGVAAERPYITGYYHPGNWRKRLDFGTGTFGDMGCHILDPVFSSVAFTSPNSVICLQGGTGPDSWGLDNQVRYTFPGTNFTTDTVTLNWFDGSLRPGKEVQALLGDRKITDQGSIYIGTTGVLYSPYIGAPVLFPTEKGKDIPIVKIPGDNHYLQWVEACRGNGAASAPFSYSGPMTESVLLGTMSTRFPKQELTWNAEKMEITNFKDANQFVRKTYRKGYEVEGL